MPPRITRKCVRYQVDWEVKAFNGQSVVQTSLKDISAIGARVEGPQAVYQSRHLEFTFLRPGDDRETRHAGVVRWMRPVAHNPGRYQMGVEFYQPNWLIERELCSCSAMTA